MKRLDQNLKRNQKYFSKTRSGEGRRKERRKKKEEGKEVSSEGLLRSLFFGK